MPLNAADARLFDIYEQMFPLDGWKELVEDFKERREALTKRLISDPRVTERDLYMAQGMNVVYSYVIELEKIMEASKKQALEFTADTLN